MKKTSLTEGPKRAIAKNLLFLSVDALLRGVARGGFGGFGRTTPQKVKKKLNFFVHVYCSIALALKSELEQQSLTWAGCSLS